MNWTPPDTEPGIRPDLRRRHLLGIGILLLGYPLLRFIGYNVPKRPQKIEISTLPPVSGVLIHNEFILFDRNDATWAVSRKCTHLGCRINFHEQGNYLECPCHQSRFSPKGRVVRGPAKVNLAVYAVEKRAAAPYYVITI